MDCEEKIKSEQYMDILLPTGRKNDVFGECVQPLHGTYDVAYIKNKKDYRENPYVLGYYVFPKIFGLLDLQLMDEIGVMQVRRQPVLQLTGKDVLLGFIDTGIAYTADIFRKADGTTRIVGIWDQTQRQENNNSIAGLKYGREYTEEDINTALQHEDPYSIVSTRDTNGHGTYLASLAAGNAVEEALFTGVAPGAEIAMVKLKPAKQYVREYYRILPDIEAYQENDIMAGVMYLEALAEKRKKPLVLCMALGSNQGSHNGMLPISRMLWSAGMKNETIIVVGTGNETSRAHHYRGNLRNELQEIVELQVGVKESEYGFTMELWGKAPDLFSIALRSPTGGYIPKISVRREKTEHISFSLENSVVEISYHAVVQETGEFLIAFRFITPMSGIWKLEIYREAAVDGRFDIWLPMEQFISEETCFLKPDEYTTLTAPSDAGGIISVATYQYRENRIYQYSGRGNLPDGSIRPDVAAPGVEIQGYASGYGTASIRKTVRSGSSVSSAVAAGCTALLAEWAFVQGKRPVLTSKDAASYLIRGAVRLPDISYPNREWGYGFLNIYRVFEEIR